MADKKTNENEQDKKYPGYPHYPASEDVMRDINVDDEEKDAKGDIVMGTDADVSQEDLILLDRAEQNMNTPDDINLIMSELDNTDADGDPLNEDGGDDLSGKDLDVPGSELDNSDEKIGEEDEENNYYSLGGDDKENLDENKE